MSKIISSALNAHLQQEETTTCTCWKVVLRDGTVLGFTDHVENLTIAGVVYQAATGYTASAVQSSAALDVDNMELLGALDQSAIVSSDVRAGRWDLGAVDIFRVNYRDLTQGILPLRSGTLGQLSRTKIAFQAELRGKMQALTQSIGRLHMPQCDADLGDARCKVNLATFPRGTVTGALTSVFSRLQVADSALTDADDWFTGGKLTMTGGLNVGYAREVKRYLLSTHTITLQEALPFNPTVGDTYSMTAGCMKRFDEDCDAKFSNTDNHRGYPDLPGMDRYISGQ